MRVYIITVHDLIVSWKVPAEPGDDKIVVASLGGLRTGQLNGERLLSLWNALPGVDRLTTVTKRGPLMDRLWSALEAQPAPQPVQAARQPRLLPLARSQNMGGAYPR